jgi:RNase adaptor protein for sRNA GlmZ degradation
MPQSPPTTAPVVALAVPLFVSAGAVNGIAIALAWVHDVAYYLVDNAPVDGPPVWVHEGEINQCFVAALPVRNE